MAGRSFPSRVSFILCDVDGTLVTQDKRLTPATIEAVDQLHRAGIGFALASARPPRGLSMLFEQLRIQMPCAAFNGGALVNPQGAVIEAFPLPRRDALSVLEILRHEPVDVWAFSDTAWLIERDDCRYIALEQGTIGFGPDETQDLNLHASDLGKIVAVSEDHQHLAWLESELRHLMGSRASIARSRPYYLDITSALAEKSQALERICSLTDIDLAETISIGDGVNDEMMLRRAAYGIAIANGAPAARAAADHITGSNDEDGVAQAIHMNLEQR